MPKATLLGSSVSRGFLSRCGRSTAWGFIEIACYFTSCTRRSRFVSRLSSRLLSGNGEGLRLRSLVRSWRNSSWWCVSLRSSFIWRRRKVWSCWPGWPLISLNLGYCITSSAFDSHLRVFPSLPPHLPPALLIYSRISSFLVWSCGIPWTVRCIYIRFLWSFTRISSLPEAFSINFRLVGFLLVSNFS